MVYFGPVTHGQLKRFPYLFEFGSSLISVPGVFIIVDLVVLREKYFD